MSNKQSQQGSVLAVVSVVLVILLVAALGWIFYQNFMNKDGVKKDTDTAEVTKEKKAVYADFRKNGTNSTGVTVSSTEDVAKLTNVGDKLAAYIKQADLGRDTPVMGGGTEKLSFVIDRLYGDYAVGTVTPGAAYTMWGPAGGDGEVKELTATQNEGFSCDDLKAAKVPQELVDGKCLATDGSGLATYKN